MRSDQSPRINSGARSLGELASALSASLRTPAFSLVFAINAALGNLGQTIVFTKSLRDSTNSLEQLKQLATDLHAVLVKTIVVLVGNPPYSLHSDVQFAEALRKVAVTSRLWPYAS